MCIVLDRSGDGPESETSEDEMPENTSDIAKRVILSAIAEGMTVEQAVASAGKSYKSYEYYRRTDPAFKDKVDRTRLGLRGASFIEKTLDELTFSQFRERFLRSKT